jgi:hypothetical protein
MFDYFAVLICVIFGLALTHLLRGLAKLIQMRHEVRPYWVHIVWTLNVVIFVLAIWWGMFYWRGLRDWSAEWFYFMATYAILQFMWASMLYPPEFPAGLDCEQYFLKNRYWFFGIQTAVLLMDIPETLMKGVAHLRAVPKEYPFLISSLLIIAVVAMFSRSRRVHGVLSVAWLLITLGYTFFIPVMARIVGPQ